MNQTIDRSSSKPTRPIMVAAQILIITGLIAYFAPNVLQAVLKQSDITILANNAIALIVIGLVLELIFIIQVIKFKQSKRTDPTTTIEQGSERPARIQLSNADYSAISRSPIKSGGANFKTHNFKAHQR